VDARVLEKIICAAEVCDGDCVLEIGPGLGAVTEALAEKAGRVAAVELDRQSAELLRETFSTNGNVEIICGDILKTDLKELFAPNKGFRYKAVANLPYYITTPVLMYLLEGEIEFAAIVLMVQLEVANRLTAAPSTKDYGALTLAARYYADVEIAAFVPPNCFMPRPRVDSAVVKLTPRSRENKNKEFLFHIVRAAFNQRRKTLVNALSNYANADFVFDKKTVAEAIESIGQNENVRGEALSLAEFERLAEAVAARIGNEHG